MRTLFGMEISAAGQYLIAFIIIFLLLAIFAVVLRKITGSRMKLTGGGTRARQPRLGVVDIFDLDRQRQLVLVRRDNVEHLVMIGGPNDVVVETAIVRSGAGRIAAPSAASAAEALERALQPELPLERRVEPSRPAPETPSRLAMEPPATRVETKPAEPRFVEPKTEPPKSAPLQPPRPPEMRKPLEPRATQPGEPARPTPEPARAAARLEPEIKTEFKPEPRMPVPPPPEPAPALKADDPRLTEMARQLEEALKKPFSAVRPAAPTAEPPARPELKAPLPPPPVLKPPAAPLPSPPPAPPILKPTLDDAPMRPAAPVPPRPVMPAPPEAKPAPTAPKLEIRPEPETTPEAAPAPKPETKAPDPKTSELDPFSPEAIEAEFARLLGRSTKSD